MKRLLKLAAFLSLWVFFFGLVALVHLWISVLGMPNRWKIISRINRTYTLLLRSILNIKLTIVGNEGQLERGGYVIIANHVGYIDGIVLGSIFPIVFVSKKEVRSWPIVGQWNLLCGTVFIDRQHKEQVGDVPEIKARSQYSALPRGYIDQRRTDVAFSDRPARGASAQPVGDRADDSRIQIPRRRAN
jgi:1-acyl-sn-glycerol-3-phosphate acyltransferase